MSAANAARVTAQDLFDYDKCPHRVYLNRFGDESEKLPQAAFLSLLFERALSHEEDVVGDLACETPSGATLEARAQSTLELMKRGVMLINTSRGALIDSQAALKACKSGQIGYLGLDVYEEEGVLACACVCLCLGACTKN